MAKRTKQAWLVRFARAHMRLWTSAALGLAIWTLLPADLHAVTRTLIAWDGGVAFYLGFVAFMMARSSIAEIARHAKDQDEGAFALMLLTVASAVASLGAIFAELAMVERKAASYGLHVVLAVGTVILSWLFVHTIFALHYAYEFYGEGKRARGLNFPNDEDDASEDRPDYWDFLYFALVIGMTFQVSDVQVTNKWIRRSVMVHGLLSFLFVTTIVALTVNIAATVIQK